MNIRCILNYWCSLLRVCRAIRVCIPTFAYTAEFVASTYGENGGLYYN